VGSVFALLSRYAALIWNQGLHQGASLSLAPGTRMDWAYKVPLYVAMAGFVLVFVALVLAGTRTEIRARRARALIARERAATP
jgi:heme exporter protein C